MSILRRLVNVVCALICLAVLLPRLQAQASRGAVSGLVTDPSGAVMVGVQVTARNIETNVLSSAVTTTTGNYAILHLTPGTYEITAHSSGFATSKRGGVRLQVGDSLQVDFTLQPADVNTSIVVAAETPLLSTTSGSSGTVIEQRQIAELPLPYGNPFMLASLASGVVFTAANMLQIRPYDNGVVANIRVDGAPGGSEFTLDGAPNTGVSRGSQRGQEVAYIPPAEAVQEFKMETSSFDARQGHAPGAAVNVSVKSGTNAFHGSAWEFTRPSNLAANDFYLRRAGQKPAELRLHRFGANLGGPVILPNMYNGKDRTFFFFTYENMITDQPNGRINTVPTEAQRRGDFSALLSQAIIIYDPATAAPAPGGRIRRTPFEGNIIPGHRLNPVALNMLKYYPLPNSSGDAQGANNYVSVDTFINRFHSELARIDYHFNQRHHSFARLHHNFRDSPSTGWSGGEVNGINPTQGLGYRGNQGLAMNHVYVPRPSLIVDVTAGVTRYFVGNGQMARGFDLASLGFSPATVEQFGGARYLPTIAPSGYGTIGSGGGDFRARNTWFLKPTLTKLVGRHSLYFGGESRVDRENNAPASSPAGTYSFANTYTRGPLDNSAGAPIGQSFASMLLGIPTGGSVNRNATSATQRLYNAVFVHDDFKATRRLTLNLGFRYEVESPTTERYNRNVAGFDAAAASPIEDLSRARYQERPDPALSAADFHLRGGLLFAGESQRGFWETRTRMLQPRAGAAFQLTPKTVLRGGWGTYMIPFGIDGVNQPGFQQVTDIVASRDNGLSFVANLTEPFPSGILEPVGSSAGLATDLGQAVSFLPGDRAAGKVQRWQLGLQRELPGRWVVEVSYAGTRGYDMAVGRNLNATPVRYLSTSPIRDITTINFLTAQVPNPMAGLLGRTTLSGTTIPRSQLLSPFPHFSSVTSESYDGGTRYHGVEVRANHRFQHGYTLNASYSHSRLRERLSYLNPTDPLPEDRVSGDDRPNRFTINGIWELPFGKGRTFGRSWRRLTDGVLGGWQLNGVYVIQSGRPLSVGNLYFTGNPEDLKVTYDRNRIDSTVFDTSSFYFADTPVQTNGVVDTAKQRSDQRIQLAQNIRTLPSIFANFRGDRIRQLDASLMKTVRFGERARVQVRAELINLLNQVQFDNPGLGPTSANFGRITASSQLNPPRTTQVGLKVSF